MSLLGVLTVFFVSSTEHYVFVNEYLWQVIEEKEPLGMMLGILDLQGLNMRALRQKEVINFLKLFVATMDSHFPQRAHKTMLVNAPKWFNLVYKLISPLLRESTKAKIEILSRGKKQDKALKSRIGDNAEKLLPKSFFSEKKQRGKRKRDVEDTEHDDRLEMPETKLEMEFRSFVSWQDDCFDTARCRLTLLFSQVSGRLKETGAQMEAVSPL